MLGNSGMEGAGQSLQPMAQGPAWGAKLSQTQFRDFRIMPRKRTPLAVAKATNSHPERYINRVEPPVRPLGSPPKHLSDTERDVWQNFANEMPWLARSDRHIVAIASRLSVLAERPGCPIGIYAQLRLCLSAMGGTPCDKTRVHWQVEAEVNPADEFLN
jgi:hypothetical protein